MKSSKGITLIELIVVIAIIGILLGATVSRMVGTSQANELEMAANLVQSALNQAKELARSPKPSGDISSEWDINGYGVVFNYNKKTEFSIFADVVDSNNPENQNKWVDPQETDADDRIIKTYDFSDVKISNVNVIDWFSNTLSNPVSFVFSYSEKPQEEKIYVNGITNYEYVSVYLKHYSGIEKQVRVYLKTGIIEII